MLRTGLYIHPNVKNVSLEAEAYPLINDIVETDLEIFINNVVGHGLTIEEFELFVKLRNEEFETQREIILHLEQGYEDQDTLDEMTQQDIDDYGYKPDWSKGSKKH